MFHKINLLVLLIGLFAKTASATYILPSDYEDNGLFIQVSQSMDEARGTPLYTYYECQGDLHDHECNPLFGSYKFSQLELNALEREQKLQGTGLLVAEVAVGGIIWKRITRFVLEKANQIVLRKVARDPDWVRWRGQDVATGTLALGITLPTSTAITIAVVHTANQTFETIDPFDRFKRSNLIDTDEFQGEEAILPVKYDFDETLQKLNQLLE